MDISKIIKKTMIHLILTGGTITKEYNEVKQTLENVPSMNTFLKLQIRLPHIKLQVNEIFCKDSRNIVKEDIESLIDLILELQKDNCPIVIIHGTDKMVENSQYIKNIIKPKVPIVFTGSMTPMVFNNSDAMQNVTEALMISQYIKPGIYISFHCRLYDPDNTYKNYEKSIFSEKNEKKLISRISIN